MASSVHDLPSNSYRVSIAMTSSTHDQPSNSYRVSIAMTSSTHDQPSNSYRVSIVYKRDVQTFANNYFCHYNSSIIIAIVGYYWWLY